jgi:hypothetical protein
MSAQQKHYTGGIHPKPKFKAPRNPTPGGNKSKRKNATPGATTNPNITINNAAPVDQPNEEAKAEAKALKVLKVAKGVELKNNFDLLRDLDEFVDPKSLIQVAEEVEVASVELAKQVCSAEIKLQTVIHAEKQKSQVMKATIDLPKTDETGQTNQVIHSNHYLSPAQLKYVKQRTPGIQVVFNNRLSHHEHPILHLDREVAEKSAIDYLQRMGKKVEGDMPADHKIIDIGGNPDRHAKNHRKMIHSCNPVISGADVIRNMRYNGLTNYCQHKAEDCNCYEPYAHLSIDSLYYLSPSQIAQLCASCNDTECAPRTRRSN